MARMPSCDVNELMHVDIRLKGVKEFTLRLRIAKVLLMVTSKILHGSGCSVEMMLEDAPIRVDRQDPRYQLSHWLQQIENASAIKSSADRRFKIEEAKSEIMHLLVSE